MALGAMPIITVSSSRNEPWLSHGLHPANEQDYSVDSVSADHGHASNGAQ
jgi:hypothetical protein